MLENFREAFDGIWSHKLRSALTMLGIIIGIASIIAISSTIMGTNRSTRGITCWIPAISRCRST